MIIAACGDAEHSQTAAEKVPADSSGSDVVASSTVTAPSGKSAVKSAAGKTSATSIGKRSAPISFRYEIEGKAIVGQPVVVKIFVASSVTDVPISVVYRVHDASSMLFPDSQIERRVFAPAESDELRSQKVTVIPQREGRLYLNVSAEIETANGMMIKTTSIPIQVGSAPPELEVNGKLVETADGEVVVSMPAE